MTDLTTGTNTYFASDFHLGLAVGDNPADREKMVVGWLNSIRDDAKRIYLVGDVFDFWWEYRNVVPKGFTRFLGKISELTDNGIEIHFFGGNHDMWFGNYLSEECGMILHHKPVTLEMDGRKFFIAHGEGLGITDPWYKALLAVFRSRFLQKLYSSLHPGIGVGIGHSWSKNSRLARNYSHEFKGEENEELFSFARKKLSEERIDYFIFGHRHLAIDYKMKEGSRLFIMGNWFNDPCYLVWDGTDMRMVKLTSR